MIMLKAPIAAKGRSQAGTIDGNVYKPFDLKDTPAEVFYSTKSKNPTHFCNARDESRKTSFHQTQI